jgi:rhamnose utilization protein RhaD (predicted bifunctional aldolase and dehydrogenase)
MTEEGFVALDREKLRGMSTKRYSNDPVVREEQVKADMEACITDVKGKRPSVETSLHELISYKFVVHLHPALVNGILCSRSARKITLQLFDDTILFVPYTDPGFTLFRKLEEEMKIYRQKFKTDPKIIFLENHGVFVGADTTEEIRQIYSEIINRY